MSSPSIMSHARLTRRRRVNSLVAVIAAIGLSLGLAACGSGTDNSGSATASGGGGGTSTTAPAPKITLTYATGAAPRTLDVLTVDDHPTTELLVPDVYEALTRITFDADGNHVWVPALAESWEEVTSSQWRFHIRPGVVFHDGSPLTADDVVFSITRRLDPNSEQIGLLAQIERAEKVDDMTVDVFATGPNPFVYRAMYGIAITPDGWGVDNASAAATTANGTGPYQLTSYTDGGNNATLTRFDGYWGEPAIIDEIKMRVIPEASAAFQALQTGEVDVVDNLTPDLIELAPAVLTHEAVLHMMARFGTENPLMSDVSVRQAVNMALDRDSIIRDIYKGYASPALGQIIPPGVIGFNPDLTDYPYDPERAKQMIADAGVAGWTITVLCSSDRYGAAGRDICEVLKQNLEDIGLQVNLQYKPTDQWTNEGLYAPKNGITPPDVFVAGAGTSDGNGGNTMRNWLTCGSDRNTYCDPDLQARINEALVMSDAEQQQATLQAIMAEVKQAAPFLFGILTHTTWGVGKNVEGTVYSEPADVRWADWSFSG